MQPIHTLKIRLNSNNTFLTLTKVFLKDYQPSPRFSPRKFERSRFFDDEISRKKEPSIQVSKDSIQSKPLFTTSARLCQFRNAQKKGSNQLPRVLVNDFVKKLNFSGISTITIEISRFNKFRDTILNLLTSSRTVRVLSITDTTSLAHNGCRPGKKRRL